MDGADKYPSTLMSDGHTDENDDDVEDEESDFANRSNKSTLDLHLQDALDAVVAAAAAYTNPVSVPHSSAHTSNLGDTANSSFNSVPPTTSYSSSNSKKKHHHFFKELRCLMYGFGDDKQPYTESIELLEEIVVEFIKNFTLKALDVGKNGKIQLEDVWYLIRRDPKKYCRVKDLLTMNEELRKARKAFDEAKY